MSDFSSYGGASKEWLAIEAGLPPVDYSIPATERRDATNSAREKAAAKSFEALADLVETADYSIATRDGTGTIGARMYWPKAVARDPAPAVYFHLPGGGYLYGTLGTEDATAARIAVGAGVVVVSINYRRTPEHPYPAAWHDSQDAFLWLHGHAAALGIDPHRVVVGGISAGGHLAASLAQEQLLGHLPGHDDDDAVRLRPPPPIAGQLLMVPALVHQDCYGPLLAGLANPAASSRVENVDAPVIPLRTLQLFTDLLQVPHPDPADTLLNPGNARPDQVQGLPPTVVAACGLDPLRDENLLYAKRLAEQG